MKTSRSRKALAAALLALSVGAPTLAAVPAVQDKPQRDPGVSTTPTRPTNAAPGAASPNRPAAPSGGVAARQSTGTTPKVPPSLSPTKDPNVDVAAPSKVVESNLPPIVEFDPPTADLGEMTAGLSKSMTVKIRNISSEPIRITKAIANCGCTTPQWPKDPIAPGATGEIEVAMKANEKAGRMSKQVTLQFESGPPAVLKVEGDVITYINIAPEMLSEPSETMGAASTKVVLESSDGTPFLVTSVAPPVVLNLPTEAATRHDLDIDWATWRETGRQMRVTFSTDNPKAPRLVTVVRRALTQEGASAPTPPTRAAANLGTTELITAVRAADLDKVRALIDSGVDVNELDNAGSRTALFWAAKGGNLKAVEMLLAAGANPNLPDRTGRTSLWAAVEFGVDAVRALVEKGGDLTVRDTLRSTPLLWASGFGSPDTVRYLLEKSADVKAIDDNGWTTLIWAAGLGQPGSVKILIDAGAPLNDADKQTGDTPLLRAARTGQVENLKLLVDAKADLTARNKNNQTALHLAAQSGVPEKVAILLAAGVDPAAVDVRNWTALDHALARTTGDKTKLVELLKPVSPAPSVSDAGTAKGAAPTAAKGG